MNNQTTKLGNVNDWLRIVATAGVIASIIFLVFELRQNSELMKAQIYQSRAETLQSAFLELSESEYLIPILIKINTARGGGATWSGAVGLLSEEEKIRISYYYERQIRHLDNMYFQHELGLIDDEYMEWWARIVQNDAPIWYEIWGGEISGRESFKKEVQEILENAR